MSQVARLIRIDHPTFEKMEDTEKLPTTFVEDIDVDKLWEPIMYVLGEGSLGRAPIVNLFMPQNLLDTNEDEYMTEGIRYHDIFDIQELHDFINDKSIDQLVGKVNVEKMNTKIMYPISEADLAEVKQYIVQIKECLRQALENEHLIVAVIG